MIGTLAGTANHPVYSSSSLYQKQRITDRWPMYQSYAVRESYRISIFLVGGEEGQWKHSDVRAPRPGKNFSFSN